MNAQEFQDLIHRRGVELAEVIITHNHVRGNGKETPYRILTQVYTTDGFLIAEHDPTPTPEETP